MALWKHTGLLNYRDTCAKKCEIQRNIFCPFVSPMELSYIYMQRKSLCLGRDVYSVHSASTMAGVPQGIVVGPSRLAVPNLKYSHCVAPNRSPTETSSRNNAGIIESSQG